MEEQMEEKPEEKKEKWYFKTNVLVIALLCVGPLALPLTWFNPRFSLKTKLIINIITVVLTYYLTVVVADSLKNIMNYYKTLSGM